VSLMRPFVDPASLWRGLWLRLCGLTQHGGALLGLCCIVVLWGGVLHSLSAEREQALRGGTDNAANLARAFDEHIIRSIRSVDQTLLYVRDSYVRDPAGFEIASWAKGTRFLTDLAFQVSLIDKSGFMIGSNLAAAGTRLDLGDREHFRVHRDNPGDELFISKPVLGRESHKWSIQITRKIIAPDGSFAGVVVVSLDPQYLSKFYDSVDVGPKGLVSLTGTDGVVRARAAAGDTTIGQSMAGGPLMQAFTRAPSGTFKAVSPIDHVARVYAYRGVRSYPLIVLVGVAEADLLANFESNRRGYLEVTTALTVLLMFVSVMIMRQEAGFRRTREDLRASEARYAQKSTLLEAALENMSQGIMMISADRRVLVCNRRAMLKLDLPDVLMESQPLFDDVLRWQWRHGEFGRDGGDDAETWLRRFVLSGGIAPTAQRYERQRPNGMVLEIQSAPLPDGSVVRTFTDITEQKQTEAVLRAARDEAHRAARAKSEFLAMMSHEIRSPMNGLLGIIELLRDTRLETDQANMVAMAHESAASLLGILNDVLDFSKIEAGAIAVVPEPVAVHALVQGLVDAIALSAARKGLRVSCRLADDVPPWIEVDPLRLRQILGNLIGNAIKFTAAGAVELAVSRSSLPEDAPALEFAVSDTGIGMSPEVLQRLFEPFMQADASTTKNFGGSGLGLSISRRLAQLLGGGIGVTSVEGQGSVFTLTIALVPAIAPDGDRDGESESHDDDALRGLRVLVAEDQQTNRWLINRQLSKLGIVSEIVEDGFTALAAFSAGDFALLVTDCHMPGMDGAALARRIRTAEAENGRPRMPILGLTADVTPEMRQQCLAAGMDDVVSKPIDQRRLEAALRRIMAHQAAGVAEQPTEEPDTLFDDTTFRDLFEGAEDEGRDWLSAYLDAAADTLVQIQGCLASDDRDALRAVAHRLAGTSLSAGATRVGMLARRLEQAEQPDRAALAAEIARALSATGHEIRRLIGMKTELVS